MKPPPIRIHHQDERIVVVEKPPGIHVHRTHLSPDRDVLLTRVRDQLGRHLHPVHRLDRATSGLLVFALDPTTAASLQEAWSTAAVEKEYLALVRGTAPAEMVSERPLTRREDGVRQDARTEFRSLGTDRGFSLVLASLRTGRRHQIRRHLAHEGHQIVGDTTYGKGGINRWLREEHDLPRLLLHAHRLTLPRAEADGVPLTLRSPLPEDFSRFLTSFSPALRAQAEELLSRGSGGDGRALRERTP